MLTRIRPLAALGLLTGALYSQPATEPFAWQSVNLQGMGFVTLLAIHPLPPHDIYIGTDVGGAYRLDRRTQRWLPLTDFVREEGPGVLGIEALAVDPADASTVYLSMPFQARLQGFTVSWAGEVLVSRDRGATWSPTGLAAHNIYMGPNADQRGLVQNRLAVDAAGRVFYATRRQGLWVRADQQWRRLAGGLPASAPEPGFTFVVTDPSQPGRLYAGVAGSGVWRSDDSGSSWQQIETSPNPTRGAVSVAGVLYVSFGSYSPTRGAVRRYRGGQWSNITPITSNQYWAGLALDPSAPDTLLAATDSNLLVFRSTDSGDSWVRIPYAGVGADQPGYFVRPYASNFNAPSGGWGNAGLAIDPANPRHAWLTNGYGVMRNTDVLAATSSWGWVQSNLEELVVQRVVVPPVPGGADLLLVAMDMVGFRVESRHRVPADKFATFPWVAQGNSMSYAGQMPEHMAFVGWDQTNRTRAMTGLSSDNGRTWTPFPDVTPGVAGNIAMAARDPRNLVWGPASGSTPVFTRDGGRTWQKCRAGDSDLRSGWQLTGSEYWASQVLAADAVEEGRFYYYLQPGSVTPGQLWTSTDGGATWTLQSTITEAGRAVANTVRVNLVPHPLRAGELWLAHSRNSNQTGRFQLLRSRDAGRTWAIVPGLLEARFVAFGRGATDATPAVYVLGIALGEEAEAVYRSEDEGVSWTRVSDPDRLGLGGAASLAGDLRTRDLVYIGTHGRGVLSGAGPASGIPRPPVTAVVNAATYEAGGVAPGEIVTLFGNGIEGDVYFDGLPAPRLYATPTQTSVVAPFHLANRRNTVVQVMVADALSLPVTLPVRAAKPGIFTVNSQGTGQAVLLDNATGQSNSAAAPFARGTDVFVYLSGGGATQPAGVDGLLNGTQLPRLAAEVWVEVGGVRTPAQYAGGAPGFLQGLTQVNFRIPADAPTGPAVPLAVVVGGVRSTGTATMAVR